MEVHPQELINVLTEQRNNCFNEAAIATARVRMLEKQQIDLRTIAAIRVLATTHVQDSDELGELGRYILKTLQELYPDARK